MMKGSTLPERIFEIADDEQFAQVAMEVFHFQYRENKVYRKWCQLLERTPESVHRLEEIPFLPIEFFKSHQVVSFQGNASLEFTSSGTTGSVVSRHLVADDGLYQKSFLKGFRQFYGDPHDYCILALLPGYLERESSSLVYMVNHLIGMSGHPQSGFYLNQLRELHEQLRQLMQQPEQKVLLLGVSFALLDLAEQYPLPLTNTIIMETGGMKGRRREMVREELHQVLKEAFHQQDIHSEYGMTELLSQAYSCGEGIFRCPGWMRIMLRDSNDPLSMIHGNRAGGINVIDLANLYSCSFIATQDLGRLHPGGHFEVLGRFDFSDTRGCNLMVV